MYQLAVPSLWLYLVYGIYLTPALLTPYCMMMQAAAHKHVFKKLRSDPAGASAGKGNASKQQAGVTAEGKERKKPILSFADEDEE